MNPAIRKVQKLDRSMRGPKSSRSRKVSSRKQVATKPAATFSEFIERHNPTLLEHEHVQHLAAVLDRVVSGELRRVMVFMPPRYWKSEVCSRLLPAYFLRKHPNRFVGITSYGATLADDLSREARAYYLADGGKMRTDSQSVSLWKSAEGRGGVWSAGVGGGIIGKGFHLGIIDDPYARMEEALSPRMRERSHTWHDGTWGTRREPNEAEVIIMQRWHPDDLAGHLLKAEQRRLDSGETAGLERWHVVVYEAEYSGKPYEVPASCTVEPDWREVGDVLAPKRFSAATVSARKAKTTGYVWSSTQQQRPGRA